MRCHKQHSGNTEIEVKELRQSISAHMKRPPSGGPRKSRPIRASCATQDHMRMILNKTDIVKIPQHLALKGTIECECARTFDKSEHAIADGNVKVAAKVHDACW